MIDLHTHTNRSDGTSTPEELVDLAKAAGVEVLGVSDHDTFAGYDACVPLAESAGMRLICGIELSTKLAGTSVHLLGYFLSQQKLAGLRQWVLDMQASRRDRNVRLVARLQELGCDINLAEAEALGHGMTGRPHFAKLLLQKGYVSTMQQAFDDYLDASAKGYVDRREPQFVEAVELIREAGGIASLAHPVRLNAALMAMIPELCSRGLNAIEVYHSDHSPENVLEYSALAKCHNLLITGGSDFHGTAKPGIQVGTGRNGNLKVPPSDLTWLQ